MFMLICDTILATASIIIYDIPIINFEDKWHTKQSQNMYIIRKKNLGMDFKKFLHQK